MESVPSRVPERSPSAYYWATVQEFASADPAYITGKLVLSQGHNVELEQLRAWEEEIAILAPALRDVEGTIYLEFDVPRLASRIDAVLICGPAILAIEFKIGERFYRTAHYNQVWDYALDLKNFHRAAMMRRSFRCSLQRKPSRETSIGAMNILIGYGRPVGVRPPGLALQ